MSTVEKVRARLTTVKPFDGHVRRVQDGHTSRVEPPFNDRWEEIDKLRWRAAVVTADVCVEVGVEPSDYYVNGHRQHGYYDVYVEGAGSIGPESVAAAWHTINGVEMGVRAARRQGPGAA